MLIDKFSWFHLWIFMLGPLFEENNLSWNCHQQTAVEKLADFSYLLSTNISRYIWRFPLLLSWFFSCLHFKFCGVSCNLIGCIFLYPGDLVADAGPTPGPRPALSSTMCIGQLASLSLNGRPVLARNWGLGIFIREDIRQSIRTQLRTAFTDPQAHRLGPDVCALLLHAAWPGRSYTRFYNYGSARGTVLQPFHKARVTACWSELNCLIRGITVRKHYVCMKMSVKKSQFSIKSSKHCLVLACQCFTNEPMILFTFFGTIQITALWNFIIFADCITYPMVCIH